jgi:hypothetical protein
MPATRDALGRFSTSGGSTVTPADTQRAVDETKARLLQATRVTLQQIVLEVDWRLRRRTPVDTGRARGNWRLGIGAPDRTVNWEEFDPSGAVGMAAARQKVQALVLGAIVWLTNGLPYIGPLERGHSKKAPAGMLAVTRAEIPMIIQMARAGFADRLHGRGTTGGAMLLGTLEGVVGGVAGAVAQMKAQGKRARRARRNSRLAGSTRRR